jgi:hypothetical protein
MKTSTPARRVALRAAAALILPTAMAQQEIGFVEEFALAPDRAAVLAQLIPGTEDYYYYHALHAQNNGQRDRVAELVEQWLKRFPNSESCRTIQRRQALLDHGVDPAKSLEFLRRELGLEFNHQRAGRAEEQRFPSVLDPAEIAWQKFLDQALAGATRLENLDEPAFFELLAGQRELTPAQRRDLLARATLPDLPGLVPLIVADLATRESRGFGEFPIHASLTLAQLDELQQARPELARDERFVHARLAKLLPGPDSNPTADPAARTAYLDRAWAFAAPLEPAFNSLKAHLLYQRLVHDRSLGIHDRERFLAYLKLPRHSPLVRPAWQREDADAWRHPADLNRDFRPITHLPPVGSDEPLVRAYLLELLKDAENTADFAPYLAENWLNAVFAETKIVHGIGDPERWASLLGPAAFQALKDRVDIEFDPVRHAAAAPAANAQTHGIDDPVRLRVHLKNVPKLLVKVFEIDPLNYYLEHAGELSTDLPLDGLVAHHERTVETNEPPARRLARDFEFPEIGKRRGVWVVEFIGGGKSSRAVIRKGRLTPLTRVIPEGIALTVLDEKYQPVPGAAAWFGGRRFTCDAQGRTLIPFSTDPGQRPLVLEDGSGFATLARLDHAAEIHQLHAGIHVDREALRPGALATLALRPTLTVAGQPVSLSRLSDVRLVLVSTDLDQITTTTAVPGFAIASDREATHEFRVPDRLASLSVQLFAKIKVASRGGEEIELSAAKVFPVNEHLRGERVDDLHLGRDDKGHRLELLGRSGEPRAGRPVNLALHRPGFKNPRQLTLATDADGAIDLGPLDGISRVSASAPGGATRSWPISGPRRTQPADLNVAAGEPVRIPHAGALDRSELAFFAVHPAGGIVADAFDRLKLEGGFLVAADLAPGDYQLVLKRPGDSVLVRVAAAEQAAGHLFNAARTLETDPRPPAHLAALAVEGEQLAIDVANADPLTRVHVVATRFLPDHDLFAHLGLAPRAGRFAGAPAWLPNLFLSGRSIGDEFRYILERRYHPKLPGNMLERPELLLNPWALRDTAAGREELKAGEDYIRQAPGGQAGGNRPADAFAVDAGALPAGSPTSIDFLRNPPATLFNLQPDENGRIRIPLEALGDRQLVEVLVVDPAGATLRQLALPERNTATRDLRLANPLDPARHFTERDSVTLLKAGEKLELPDILTSRFEVFDHLDAAYRYLLALRDDPVLREFAFITGWPSLDAATKRELYSKHACHELSFFIARKDPEFFQAVVLPHLKNKKDRTFLDDYLLGADLVRWLEPFEYSRLNVPERILLARRLSDRLDPVRGDLRDRLSLVPADPARDTHLFETALGAFGMSGDRNREVDEARAKKENEISNMLQDAPAPEGAVAPPAAESQLRRQLGRGVVTRAASLPAEKEQLERSADKAKEARANVDLAFRKRVIDEKADAFAIEALNGLAVAEPDAFYRKIDSTKEWAENHYHHLPIERHVYELITENKFWLDYALHEGDAGFGSRHLGEAARSFHEAMLALAVLDLPFTAAKHNTEITGARLDFTAGSPALAFRREIQQAPLADNPPPLLVSQNSFRLDDRHRIENGEKVDKFVTGEFLTGVVYGSQVVVTNPTSSRQKLEVLSQIPHGAIPVLGHRATATRRISMEPYSTERFELAFYFPAAGDFPCFPAHVSKAGSVLAHAEPFTFHVVDQATQVDAASWAHLSQWGTEEQVLDFLAGGNLHAVDLALVAWRCRESAAFLDRALAVLDRRGIHHPVLASYALHHNRVPALRQFLLMQREFLDRCGLFLDSPLLRIDPVARRNWQHLEYKPLVNNRSHPLGGQRRILNESILTQYRNFLHILSQKPALDAEDTLGTVYYLFLQDRAEEAMARLATVAADALPTRMQHDYATAYAAFYRADVPTARAIAARYADYPVDRWRERFAAVAAQADEIDGKAPAVTDEQSRDQQQARLAAAEPVLDLATEGTTVKLSYRNLDAVTVNYHQMDLEFLFSANPFVSSEGGGFSIIRPNRTERLELPADRNERAFELPREFQGKNVLIEVVGGGKKRSQAIFANQLRTSVSENFGILTVRHAADERPLPKVYVKVYAMTDAGPQFYKDGYTDLRGKFDYASVSTTDIGNARKFSILVMSDEHGATVLGAPVPRR